MSMTELFRFVSLMCWNFKKVMLRSSLPIKVMCIYCAFACSSQSELLLGDSSCSGMFAPEPAVAI